MINNIRSFFQSRIFGNKKIFPEMFFVLKLEKNQSEPFFAQRKFSRFLIFKVAPQRKRQKKIQVLVFLIFLIIIRTYLMLSQQTQKKGGIRKSRISEGKWTRAEHDRFLKGMELYGKNWAMVQKKVKTRTITQVRSHAQKVFQNMSKEDIDSLIGFYSEEEAYSETFAQSFEVDRFSRISGKEKIKNQSSSRNEQSSLSHCLSSKKQMIQSKESLQLLKPADNLPSTKEFQKFFPQQNKVGNFMEILMGKWEYFNSGGDFLGLTGLFNSQQLHNTSNFSFQV